MKTRNCVRGANDKQNPIGVQDSSAVRAALARRSAAPHRAGRPRLRRATTRAAIRIDDARYLSTSTKETFLRQILVSAIIFGIMEETVVLDY
eukprot:6174246-Pleurochrysis_carterae.AAC.2